MSATRVETDPRISRRRRAIARGRKRRLAVRAAIVAALAAVAWAAFWSPLLAFRKVEVTGSRHTTAAEVERVSGLDRDDNLLLISTEEIAQRAETLPWVERAVVTRMLPGTVRVRIVERRPALVLALGVGEESVARWTIDARGVVLARGRAVKGLPVLAGVDAGSVEPGARLEAPEAVAALRAYRSMPRPLARRVVGIFAPTLERITFSLRGGTLVRYGAAEELRAKNAVLRAVLARLRADSRAVGYIDVRVPANPAVSTSPPADASPAPTSPAAP